MHSNSARKVLPLIRNMTESASIPRSVPSPKHTDLHVITSGSVPSRNESISSAQTLTLNFEISMLSPIIGDLTPKTISLDTLLCDKKAVDPSFKNIIKNLKDLPLDSKVTLYTIVFSPENNHSQHAVLNLAEVTFNGEKRFYEASKEGGHYKSIDAFLKENKFGPGQYLYYNQNNRRQETFVRNSTPWEKVKPILDAGVLVVTVAAVGVVLLTPARSAAAPFVFPAAEEALRFSGTYFGVNGALEVKDDIDHGRFSLSTVGNAAMVVATALPFGGAAVRLFKSAEALAKAETKAEKVLKAAVTFSQLTGVAGNVTAIGAFTLEQALAMQEISSTKDTSDSEKKKMLLYATAQMLVNTGLIFLAHKGSKKITQFKNGELPQEALPKAKNKLAVDKILHSYYEKLWQKTLNGKKATISAIKSFYGKGGAGAKEYLSRLYELTNVKIKQLKDSAQSGAKQSLKALKYSLILFSHQSQIPLVAEEISLSMATADGFKVPGPSLWKLRVPNKNEAMEASVFFARQSERVKDPYKKEFQAIRVKEGIESLIATFRSSLFPLFNAPSVKANIPADNLRTIRRAIYTFSKDASFYRECEKILKSMAGSNNEKFLTDKTGELKDLFAKNKLIWIEPTPVREVIPSNEVFIAGNNWTDIKSRQTYSTTKQGTGNKNILQWQISEPLLAELTKASHESPPFFEAICRANTPSKSGIVELRNGGLEIKHASTEMRIIGHWTNVKGEKVFIFDKIVKTGNQD